MIVKTAMKIVLGVALVLIIAGLIGWHFIGNDYSANSQVCPLEDDSQLGYVRHGMMGGDYGEEICLLEAEECPIEDDACPLEGEGHAHYRGRGMMGGYYNNQFCPY